MQEIILIADPRVLAIPIKECGEPLVDLRENKEILFGPSPEIPDNQCYTKVRQGVFKKLCEAQNKLPPGVFLCLYEGWRSLELQKILFDKMQAKNQQSFPQKNAEELYLETTKLVAPVQTLSGESVLPPHATGGAVDLYLVDKEGNPLEMGLLLDQWSFDEGARLSPLHSSFVSETARKNRMLMKEVLESCGFVNYATEYWHWSYGDRYWAYMTENPHAHYGPAILAKNP